LIHFSFWECFWIVFGLLNECIKQIISRFYNGMVNSLLHKHQWGSVAVKGLWFCVLGVPGLLWTLQMQQAVDPAIPKSAQLHQRHISDRQHCWYCKYVPHKTGLLQKPEGIEPSWCCPHWSKYRLFNKAWPWQVLSQANCARKKIAN